MGAPPLTCKEMAVTMEAFRAHEQRALDEEEGRCSGFLPRWLRALMARVRVPGTLLETRGEAAERAQRRSAVAADP